MKFFKTIKRKVGNAILPVVGTILGLTILAGSVVGVALNSSKIVYKQNNLSNQNDARQILYLASKYFCEQKNSTEKSDATIGGELQAIFGEGLKITKKKGDTTEETYYIWYPNSYTDNSNEYKKNADGTDNVKDWLKATISMVEKKSNDTSGDPDAELNDTLFSRDAKLDELYNVGNLMSTYLIDEGLLPAREYALTKISLIESDIDTFDEVFKYVNNSGVIEIDDIAIALYGWKDLANANKIVSVEASGSDGLDTSNKYYTLVYNLGMLGGNYYWQDDNGDTHPTGLYRQEYDGEFLANFLSYDKSKDTDKYTFYYQKDKGKNTYKTIDYTYDETNDSHTIVAKGYVKNGTTYNSSKTLTYTYSSTIEFADAIADYVFWINIDRLALNLEDFKTKINAHANNQWGGGANSYSYKWTDDGLTVYTWRGYYQDGGYWDWPYTISQVDNFLVQCGYTDDNKTVSSQKIYDALIESIQSETQSQFVLEEYENQHGDITWETLRDKVCNTHNVFDMKRNVSIQYQYQSGWFTRTKTFTYQAWYSTDKMAKAIVDYVAGHLQTKYAKGNKIQGNSIGMISDDTSKLLADVQFLMVGERLKVQYHFNLILSRNNGELVNYFSEQTGDDIYFTVDEFKELFGVELAWCLQSDVTISQQQQQLINRKSRDVLKQELIDPIRYQYLPSTILSEIVGSNDSSAIGMKESVIALKLLTKYFEYYKDEFSSITSVNITSTNLVDSNEYGGCFKYTINYKINGVSKSTDLYFKYMTNSARNTHTKNPDTNAYVQGGINNNITPIEKYDADGNLIEVVNKFNFVPILDKNGEVLNKADLTDQYAICGVIPFKEVLDDAGNQVSAKVTLDGKTYKVTTDKSLLKNVNENILYNGDIDDLGDRKFKISIKKDCTLIINGKLSLLHDQTLELEDDAMILVNGDFLVFYEFNGHGNDSTDNNATPSWQSDFSSTQKATFRKHGVNIIAEDAKIMVNGNMTYRGYKARASEYYNYSRFGVDLDLVFDQTTFGVDNCQYKSNLKKWQHDSDECRSLLSGIYIINGDIKFESWAEYANPDATNNQKSYMYRNSYSNPLINATFYVDGTFNMEGLYMSGLYDECRANFIFAKSIVQPLIALNSTLSRWGMNNNEYGNWQDTNGYLFMIVEDAIDFSKVNFACVNLFTPYSQLLDSINSNQNSATNFAEFIEKDVFTTMYPQESQANTIDKWGLSSILKQGLKKMYDPGDIGKITRENEFNGAGDDVISD